ncbi:type III effector protein [Candidatus Regiella endosymbiont of Tuberolachnus salignus]|uniref:type III effector protein n=1 Tax=Candidatus Regiella endosymbiont of Tuberolachnus salignus TaxID=3077956 RepID=UPI0030CB1E96
MSQVIQNPVGSVGLPKDNNGIKSNEIGTGLDVMDSQDVMASVSSFILMLNDLMLKLRDIMRVYGAVQQSQGWEIVEAEYENKAQAIEENKTAANIEAGTMIGGGLLSLFTLPFSSFPAGMAVGMGGAKSIEGSGKYFASNDTRSANLSQLAGELQMKNAQSYADSARKLLDNATEVVSAMLNNTRSLVDVMGKILASMRLS